jgi:hypothetical protein
MAKKGCVITGAHEFGIVEGTKHLGPKVNFTVRRVGINENLTVPKTTTYPFKGGKLVELPRLPPCGANFRVFAATRDRSSLTQVLKLPRRIYKSLRFGHYDTSKRLYYDKKVWKELGKAIDIPEHIATTWLEDVIWKTGGEETEGLRVDRFTYEGESILHHSWKDEKGVLAAVSKMGRDTLKLFNRGIILDATPQNWAIGRGKREGRLPYIDLDTISTFYRTDYSTAEPLNLGKKLSSLILTMNFKYKVDYPSLLKNLIDSSLRGIDAEIESKADARALKKGFNDGIKTSKKRFL